MKPYETPKIISRIIGGLGNQLFCYAAARRMAIANDAELVIDDTSGFKYDYKYRRNYLLHHFNISCRKATPMERLEPFSRIRRYIKSRYSAQLNFEDRSYITQEGIDFDHRLLLVKKKKCLYLDGYWQSENYFKDIETIIRDDLQINPPFDNINRNMSGLIKKSNAVAIHLRFFEDPNNSAKENVSRDYYLRALKKMEKIVPNAHYFIFSDQPTLANDLIPLCETRKTIVSHNNGDENAYADLWLMTQCKHFIIANSTFSWWGSWLSKRSDKIVIAPSFERRQGQGQWGFKGLLPNDWIKL